jgi:hypothetical protein
MPYRCVGRSKVWDYLHVKLSVNKQWVVQLIDHDRTWVAQLVRQDIAQGILACDIATNKQANVYITVVNHVNTRSLTATHYLLTLSLLIFYICVELLVKPEI